MLKLLQYCNYIIIVMQIKLMLLLLLLGNFLATSRISSNFLHSEQFLCFDISELEDNYHQYHL